GVPAGRARNHRAQPRHARIARAEETPLPGPAHHPAPRPNPAPQTDTDRPDGSPIPPAPPEGTARAEDTPLPGPAHPPAPRPNPVPQDDTDRPVPRPADRYGSGPVVPYCYPPRERTG
ncbi:hypothetical protein ACFQ77_38445, partial [Streptomyces virginiae]